MLSYHSDWGYWIFPVSFGIKLTNKYLSLYPFLNS